MNITLKADIDLDVFLCLSNVLTAHLKHNSFQEVLLKQDLFLRFLSSILRTLSFTPSVPHSLDPREHPPTEGVSSDEAEQLDSMRKLLTAVLSDVSLNRAFAAKYPYPCKLTSDIVGWLPSGRLHFQTFACSILSNLVRMEPPWACQMVERSDSVYLPLVSILREGEGQSLYAALDFLLQLARPIDNKATICQQPLLSAIAKLWMGDDTQAQYATVTVLREAIKNCPKAVQRLALLCSDEKAMLAEEKTYFSILVSLFESTTDPGVQTEIAKVTFELLRCLPRLDPDDRKALLQQQSLSSPLIWAVSYNEDPGLASQAYLSLVLLSQQAEQGLVFVDSMLRRTTVFSSLVCHVRNQLSPLEGNGTSGPLQRSITDNARWLIKATLETQVSFCAIAQEWDCMPFESGLILAKKEARIIY